MNDHQGGEVDYKLIKRRVRACDYLAVAQLFLQSNFLLEKPLSSDDIKPRLLGHWGTCHGIDVAYANLKAYFCPSSRSEISDSADREAVIRAAGHSKAKVATEQAIAIRDLAPKPSAKEADTTNLHFILGPGHGFPALQANLFFDGDLEKVDPKATNNVDGLAYVCRNFSWPGGFPSHASPMTPGVVCEGGELGYALGAAYGLALGHPEKTIAVMLGDGEFETATALASLNLVKLLGDHHYHGLVLPILHLNGYKISGPTVYGRKSKRELSELVRGFGYTPIIAQSDQPEVFQAALRSAAGVEYPFIIFENNKGETGPKSLAGKKVAGNYLAHQIPLPDAKTDPEQLKELSVWLKSYEFSELFDAEKGFLK